MSNRLLLVCGSRDYGTDIEEYMTLVRVLNEVWADNKFDMILTGAQRKKNPYQGSYVGADWLAIEWAVKRSIPFIGVPAQWDQMGRGAGTKRNQIMALVWQPVACLAFPGGSGTLHMVGVCKSNHIPVLGGFHES